MKSIAHPGYKKLSFIALHFVHGSEFHKIKMFQHYLIYLCTKTYVVKYQEGHRILLTRMYFQHCKETIIQTYFLSWKRKSSIHFTTLLRKVTKHTPSTTVVATKLLEMKFVMECVGRTFFRSQDNSKDIKERSFRVREEMSSSCLRDLFTISIMSNKRQIRACF